MLASGRYMHTPTSQVYDSQVLIGWFLNVSVTVECERAAAE
jgi:hypothetical protein